MWTYQKDTFDSSQEFKQARMREGLAVAEIAIVLLLPLRDLLHYDGGHGTMYHEGKKASPSEVIEFVRKKLNRESAVSADSAEASAALSEKALKFFSP